MPTSSTFKIGAAESHGDRLASTDALHGSFFARVGGLPASASERFARWLFQAKYVRPDPWKYERSYEAGLRHATIEAMVREEPATHLLEVGCGEGLLTERLVELSDTSVTGIDLSTRALERASRRCRGDATFIQGDVRTAPLPTSDVIVVADLLYYVGDQQRVTELTARLIDSLIDGGRLVLAHPRSWASRLHAPAATNAHLVKVSSALTGDRSNPYVVECWRRRESAAGRAPLLAE